MERINLNNYEAYFLDYMEGSLSAQQEFELIDFLNKHPELKSELEIDLDDLKLTPLNKVVFDKESIRKEGIYPEEVEELMIASMEGLLTDERETELAQYVSANDLQSNFNYYRNAKLKANLSEVYGDKTELKKKDGVIIPLIVRVASVAAVLAILVTAYINNGDNSKNTSTSQESPALSGVSSFGAKKVIPHLKDRQFRFENHQGGNNLVHDVQEDNQFANEIEKPNNLNPNSDSTKENQLFVPINDSQDEIVQENDSIEKIVIPLEEDDIASVEDLIITEEPIKVITNFAGNIFNRDVSYKRKKQSSSGDYVAHHFKLGRFEFERKKH